MAVAMAARAAAHGEGRYRCSQLAEVSQIARIPYDLFVMLLITTVVSLAALAADL